ncbi:hypothetical protein CCR94_16215 [Rhodoblastus sphagnicola]|uniref:Late control protein n=1 Tax=Rhodoblastus sphagnicola TaxID=333368 RepID=A0A2S6N2T0_9HYPH|nr:contractile injection system protein, VgrG/Pvc8 family [Rhodoblastus sphagnicola]MBB4199037.1 hypothetical protein [Rhodoblastus sphagnicola]PPQ28934.1 hypothetical protein CCR94_16215 [Rhodoblastus sphagnicola]
MNPIVQIWLNGQDISGRLAGRVLAARIDETDGEKTDTLRLKVSNYDGRLSKPATGAVLEVVLGWRETGIAKQGSFKVQEVTKHGEAAVFDITAQAAQLDKTLKTQKNRNWKAPKTYGDVFQQLAGDNGLAAAVHASIAQIKIEKVVAQHGESDMHFATRLARSVGAIAKVAEGRLVIVPKGQGQSASGADIPALVVTPNDLHDGWSLGAKERPKRGKCKASMVDRASGKRKTFSAGDESNGPDYVFPHIFGTETEAKNAASAHSGHFKRNEAHFRGALRAGIIAPAAGGIITTSGFGDDDDRDWTIKHKSTAFHAGIEISFDCEVKAANPPAKEDSSG